MQKNRLSEMNACYRFLDCYMGYKWCVTISDLESGFANTVTLYLKLTDLSIDC